MMTVQNIGSKQGIIFSEAVSIAYNVLRIAANLEAQMFNLNTNDNMKKIVERIRQGKQWLISFVIVHTFLLSSRKRQNYLIMKNASMFLGLQNLAKKYDNDGDTRTAMLISSESYDYLGKFALYCNAKGLDQVKWLKMYAP